MKTKQVRCSSRKVARTINKFGKDGWTLLTSDSFLGTWTLVFER